MTTEERERWILLLLPSVMVLVAYMFLVNWSNSAQLNGLQTSWADAKNKAIQPIVLLEAEAANVKLATETSELTEERTKLAAEKKELAGTEVTGVQRVAAVARVTRFIEQHGLKVVEQEPVEAQNNDSLPVALSEARKRLSLPADRKPPVWRLKLAGSYSAMTSLLDEFTAADIGALPLRVTLDPPKEGTTTRVWTVLLMM